MRAPSPTEEFALLTDLTVDDGGLAFRASPGDLPTVVDVLLDGRRIWSFRVQDTDPGAGDVRRLPWPRVLRPYLDGESVITLQPVAAGQVPLDAVARFGTGDHPIRFVDSHGLGLMVNKWGNIGHALADYPPGIVERLLDRVDRIRAVLAASTEVDVYVTGGTLLGPYRDGHLLPNDDDADLAYLSRHAHPADVARENLAMGRALVAAGITVVRCSAGHLQLQFDHEGRPDGYVDIFTGWIDDNGWWHQLFAVRERVRREQLVPVSTLDIEGRPEPIPREPETVLAVIYGPDWAVPDPSFTFEVPESTRQRYWGWMSDQHMDTTRWEDSYRYDVRGSRVAVGSEPSEYARALAAELAPESFVVELGAGRGHDAVFLAERGHTVEAVDYVRWPTIRAAETAAARELPAAFRALNLYDPRRVIAFGAEMAARRTPTTVYAHGLLGTLWDVGRPNLYRLLSMLLRTGGRAHLDVPGISLIPEPGIDGPLHRTVSLDVLAAEMAPYGLSVDGTEEVVETVSWPAVDGTTAMTTTRMVVSWQRARR